MAPGLRRLITGGGTGIGRAVGERYVAEGAHVAVVGRQQDVLDKMVDEQPDPERWLAIEADVRDSDAMHAAVARTIERFGKLDTLVRMRGCGTFSVS